MMKKITTTFTLLLLVAATAMAQTTVTLAYTAEPFSKGTAQGTMPSAYGTFSGQTYTTNAASGFAGLTLTASSGLTIGEQFVDVNDYGNSFKFVTANCLTDYTVTLSAPDGFVITGYTLAGSANTSRHVHTLTATNGTSVVVNAPNSQGNATKKFTVSGLNDQTTSFTINTARNTNNANDPNGNTLYVPTFTVTLKDLSETYVNVTYVVEDANHNTLFTFPPVEMAVGSTVTTLPVEHQQTWFYEYNTINEVVSETNNTFTFTATVKDNAPFVPSASFANAVWHTLTFTGANNIPTYKADAAQDRNVQLPTANANDKTVQWAFVGNPYVGFTIYNKAAGSGLVLGSGSAGNDGATGANTPASLQAAGTQARELWTPKASPHKPNGFYLYNADNHALNKRSNGYGNNHITYWTGGADAGSTFVATKLPGLDELLPEAQALLTTLTNGANSVQIGYPTAAALSDFSDAITAAQNGTLDVDGLRNAMNTVKAVENTVYTPRTDVYYTINSSRGSMIYEPTYAERDDNNETDEFVYHTGNTSGTNNNGKAHINVTLDETNANHQWGFILHEGKYYMYNVGKRQFAGIGRGDYGATWTFSNTPYSITLDAGIENSVATPNVRIQATNATTNVTNSMSISPSYHGPVITYDAKGDGGIPMTFALATTAQDAAVTTAIVALLEDLQPYRDALQAAIAAANDATANVGEGVNKYSVSGGQDALDAALAAAVAELGKEDNEQTKESLQTALQTLNEAVAGLTKTLNLPAPGFYRIKGGESSKYVSNGGGNGSKYTMVTSADETTIFCYDGTNLINFKTGLCVNLPGWTWVYGNESLATSFVDGLSNGGYAIHNGVNNNNEPIFLYDDNNGPCDRGAFTLNNMASQYMRYRNWYLEPVTELPITLKKVGEQYYATFYSPVELSDISGECSVYKVTVNGNEAEATKLEKSGAPAGGVLLIGDYTGGGETMTATATVGEYTGTETATGLMGVTASEKVTKEDGESYANRLFLGTKDGKIGFYKVNTTKYGEGENTYGVTGGFKAYIAMPSSAPAGAKEGLTLVFGGVTGVETIDNGQLPIDNGAVYNLQGQKVTKAVKGVYIQNGKKVVVK